MGDLAISSEQAQALGVEKGKRLSPALEECCLRASANVSYAHAEEDVTVMTGMRVSRKTQQRLVQRHDFPSPIVETDTPVAEVQVRVVSFIERIKKWSNFLNTPLAK